MLLIKIRVYCMVIRRVGAIVTMINIGGSVHSVPGSGTGVTPAPALVWRTRCVDTDSCGTSVS